jgi:hypothetical protein
MLNICRHYKHCVAVFCVCSADSQTITMFPWQMAVQYNPALVHCELDSVYQRRHDRERLQSSAYGKGKILIAKPQTLAADPMPSGMLTSVLPIGYTRTGLSPKYGVKTTAVYLVAPI